MVIYWIFRPFLYLFMLIFFPIKVYGEKNIPKGRLLVVCNHFNKIDVFYVGHIFGNRIYFMAKKELFENKLLGFALKCYGAIPVDREKVEISTMRTVIDLLNHDKVLGVFPEGTRNRVNEELQPLKAGSGMIAVKGKAPILPIMIERHSKCFHRNRMYIGKPISFEEYYDVRFNSELNDKLTEEIRLAMLDTQKKLYAAIEEEKSKKRKKKSREK